MALMIPLYAHPLGDEALQCRLTPVHQNGLGHFAVVGSSGLDLHLYSLASTLIMQLAVAIFVFNEVTLWE